MSSTVKIDRAAVGRSVRGSTFRTLTKDPKIYIDYIYIKKKRSLVEHYVITQDHTVQRMNRIVSLITVTL